MKRANVIGSGPNGLSAAIVLAEAGVDVEVFEAEAVPGGGARTLPLTLPGFMHDFGSAVIRWLRVSFFFDATAGEHGLGWIHGEAPLAHPARRRNCRDAGAQPCRPGQGIRTGCAGMAKSDYAAGRSLGPVCAGGVGAGCGAFHGILCSWRGSAWRPSSQPGASLTHHFAQPRTRALFAGLAAHSFLSLDDTLSSAVALVLGAAAHKLGWPVPARWVAKHHQRSHRPSTESRRQALYLMPCRCRDLSQVERTGRHHAI